MVGAGRSENLGGCAATAEVRVASGAPGAAVDSRRGVLKYASVDEKQRVTRG
jgi:hypothetical protein